MLYDAIDTMLKYNICEVIVIQLKPIEIVTEKGISKYLKRERWTLISEIVISKAMRPSLVFVNYDTDIKKCVNLILR